jgi:uncharacterized protein (DUF2062 family)
MDYYLYYTPPYFLLFAGLLASVASGAAFDATLRQSVQQWAKHRSTRTLANLKGLQLLTPYLGINAGICVFLGSGLEIFGVPSWLCYLLAVPLTLFIGFLVWSQLGRILIQIEQGGSKAIDLDSIN